jgi:hypothetical protein
MKHSSLAFGLLFTIVTFPGPRDDRLENFFDQLQDSGSRADFEELNDRLDDLSELEMNGRQIRNAIAAAKRQALFLKQLLEWRHLENVINIAGSFSKHMQGVHGHTDEDNARFQQRR